MSTLSVLPNINQLFSTLFLANLLLRPLRTTNPLPVTACPVLDRVRVVADACCGSFIRFGQPDEVYGPKDSRYASNVSIVESATNW